MSAKASHQVDAESTSRRQVNALPAELLRIEDLSVEFAQRGWRKPPFRAVDRVSLTVADGETVGLVGESGSGKSTIGRAVLGLVRPSGGHIRIASREITSLPAGRRRELATDLQVVFQDPYSSLNPARTIGQTLTEPLESKLGRKAAGARSEIARLLESVRLPKDAASRYPHSFSGGQRQRIAIARALAASPRLIICDEATSALDVVTQAQVLALLRSLQEQRQLGFLFISHNLPVVAQMSHRVVVLYRGRVMEQGPAEGVQHDPLHPYTKALIAAVPVADPTEQRQRRTARAESIVASGDTAAQPPTDGCPFAPRCPHAAPVCSVKRPADTVVRDRVVACHAFDEASGYPHDAPGNACSGNAS